jgi:hypothetical protein
MSEEKQFKEAASFDDWFELNEELIYEMIRSDEYDLLWETWFGGYSAGISAMAGMAVPLWPKKTVDIQNASLYNGDEEAKE